MKQGAIQSHKGLHWIEDEMLLPFEIVEAHCPRNCLKYAGKNAASACILFSPMEKRKKEEGKSTY
jgi:hypothetical protein